MLPLPNLDDRTFEQLVREARDLIPGIFSEWTDENTHDPGITLLEMLAWHLEVQQYRLDRLTTNHERKFLKLLGEAPLPRMPARSSVVFSGAGRALKLPVGTVLRAGDTPYETERPLTVVPADGVRLSVTTASGRREVSAGDENGHAPFYPFGQDGEVGARFSIRFREPLPANEPLSLWIELAFDGGLEAKRIPPNEASFAPSGTVEWTYWAEAEDGTASWAPLPLELDETYAFHQSGSVRFLLPAATRRLSVRMTGGAYDRVPRVRKLHVNETSAAQGFSHAVVETFDGAGSPGLALKPRHALFSRGVIQAQTRGGADGGWVDWEEVETWPEGPRRAFRTSRDDGTGEVTVAFGDGVRGAIPPEGVGAIRLIAVSPELYGRAACGVGTGISGQRVKLPIAPALPDALHVQVGWVPEGASATVWHDWRRVDDFDRSRPDSRHYALDDAEGELRFSDGERGAVPPASGFPNIRVIGLRVGGGAIGNVKEGQIRFADDPTVAESITIENVRPAEGGAEPETTGEALRRVQRGVLTPDCGVTEDDIERLVLAIPGIAVSRVKAIPGFRPGIRDYPEERTLGDVTVVVEPRSRREAAKPSAGFLQTVRNYLEPYRLLTTKFHVVPPEYVKVSVRAIVVVDPRYEAKERRVHEAIDRWFARWDFGRSVYKGDVYDAIHSVPGVVYIQDVWLMADGKDVFKEEGGDVRIPPNGLVVSGAHEIELLSSGR
ncbi:putative baseplate assembly protein [Paenibacillus sp.]|uniref:putative baseplate assembly protein n=1 Tax=Paenibacillus sp. TaxID=58172 RepID=UPI00281107E2|nr:putative baseplate assembly protein [Paenibacillus sp.]